MELEISFPFVHSFQLSLGLFPAGLIFPGTFHRGELRLGSTTRGPCGLDSPGGWQSPQFPTAPPAATLWAPEEDHPLLSQQRATLLSAQQPLTQRLGEETQIRASENPEEKDPNWPQGRRRLSKWPHLTGWAPSLTVLKSGKISSLWKTPAWSG